MFRFQFTRKTVKFRPWFALVKAKSCIKSEMNFISTVKSLNTFYSLYTYQSYHFWIHTTPFCNWWRSKQCLFSICTMHEYCDVIHIALCKICIKCYICFKIKSTNSTSKFQRIFLMHFKKDFQLKSRSGLIVRIKNNINSFKNVGF